MLEEHKIDQHPLFKNANKKTFKKFKQALKSGRYRDSEFVCPKWY